MTFNLAAFPPTPDAPGYVYALRLAKDPTPRQLRITREAAAALFGGGILTLSDAYRMVGAWLRMTRIEEPQKVPTTVTITVADVAVLRAHLDQV